ncbi:hypothetical protein KCG44_09905 [Pacificimonas sp. WHA3]|uniref:DUF2268 domain-containing protein n=1 Tax=Pacificimonas pallii TaxID=2827236 RepID=A0ABS6SFB4_9SPHN|nr:hypothetical protein [Pacificimonas pallii]MBV7257094.1 hypothetical protein [Pacificimonas pallii]
MRILTEQADRLNDEGDFAGAAQLLRKARVRAAHVPAETYALLGMQEIYAYIRADQPDAAIPSLGALADAGFRLPGNLEAMAGFDRLLGDQRADAAMATIRGHADRYRAAHSDPGSAPLVFEDVPRFWAAYDLASETRGDRAKAAIFRRHYLAPGTPGLVGYHWLKTGTAEALVRRITSSPEYYDGIRERTLAAATFEPTIRAGLHRFKALYPGAYFPPVTFVIGRLNSGGTAGPEGLMIGLDVWGWSEGVSTEGLSDGLVKLVRSTDMSQLPMIVVHEQIHSLQEYGTDQTLLMGVLQEGTADFLAHLALPDQERPPYYHWGIANEERIWHRLQAEMDSEDWSDWIGNNGSEIAKGWHADAGYFIGSRIAQAYYERAGNKQQAIVDLLSVTDPHAVLERSGYAGKGSRYGE